MIRFSILAGVSSDQQARDDHASIPDQIATCRKVVEQLDGQEVSVYVMDGYSRTGYDSLSDAMRDIPPLRSAIEAAEAGEYDVLIMDNFDRLGDLGQMVNTRFRKHKKQLYSARQSGRVHDPISYDPYTDESSDIAMHVEGIIQRYRLNKLRRGLILGVKKRVEDGKYSFRFPYGYKKVEGELVLDTPVADLLIQLKDRFFAGDALRDLQAIANASGVPSPSGGMWHFSTIAKILANPFYAGRVFINRWKMIGTKRVLPNGKRSSTMKLNPDASSQPGKHPALWTWDEHLRILTEMQERYKINPRHNPRNFSGLLICSICGKRLKFKSGAYRCFPGPDHIRLLEADANSLIGLELAGALRDFTEAPPLLAVGSTTEKAIAELERQITRVQRGFRDEIYNATEAKEEVARLRAQIESIESRKHEKEHRAAAHARVLAIREKLLPDLDLLPEMFSVANRKVKNNRMLRDMLTAIIVSPDRTFTFDFR